VLATDTKAPVVTQTTVVPDLLQPLKVIPELHVESVRNDLGEPTILVILLPVEEPVRDLELAGVGNHSHEALKLIWGQFTSPLVHVDVGLLADDVGEAAADTLDGGEREHDLLLAIHVGVEQTQDVLEVLPRDQRHGGSDWRGSGTRRSSTKRRRRRRRAAAARGRVSPLGGGGGAAGSAL